MSGRLLSCWPFLIGNPFLFDVKKRQRASLVCISMMKQLTTWQQACQFDSVDFLAHPEHKLYNAFACLLISYGGTVWKLDNTCYMPEGMRLLHRHGRRNTLLFSICIRAKRWAIRDWWQDGTMFTCLQLAEAQPTVRQGVAQCMGFTTD